jgi:hypothetical protein
MANAPQAMLPANSNSPTIKVMIGARFFLSAMVILPEC